MKTVHYTWKLPEMVKTGPPPKDTSDIFIVKAVLLSLYTKKYQLILTNIQNPVCLSLSPVIRFSWSHATHLTLSHRPNLHTDTLSVFIGIGL